MDADKESVERKKVLKLSNNEIVALVPSIFDAGFDYSTLLIHELKEFAKSKGYILAHLDIVIKMSYDLNTDLLNNNMSSLNTFTIYEESGKYFAVYEAITTLKRN